MALLNIEDIRIEFPSRRGTLVAVDGVSPVSYTHLTLPTICSV